MKPQFGTIIWSTTWKGKVPEPRGELILLNGLLMTCHFNYRVTMTSLNLQGEMCLFAVYGNQHRDPQLVKV